MQMRPSPLVHVLPYQHCLTSAPTATSPSPQLSLNEVANTTGITTGFGTLMMPKAAPATPSAASSSALTAAVGGEDAASSPGTAAAELPATPAPGAAAVAGAGGILAGAAFPLSTNNSITRDARLGSADSSVITPHSDDEDAVMPLGKQGGECMYWEREGVTGRDNRVAVCRNIKTQYERWQ